jgi:hypothetical protein
MNYIFNTHTYVSREHIYKKIYFTYRTSGKTHGAQKVGLYKFAPQRGKTPVLPRYGANFTIN